MRKEKIMVETEVHVVKGKINIEIKNEKTSVFVLNPDAALELGITLLKAAYSVKPKIR
jgi:hypothetical protein